MNKKQPEESTILAGGDAAGARLDRFLSAHLPALSRTRVQSLIRSGVARLNGAVAKPGAVLRSGDVVTIGLIPRPDQSTAAKPEQIPLDVLHEDDDLIVVNKPGGLVVHPAAGNWSGTLVNALLHHTAALSAGGDPVRPGIVHRLDKETSGCLVVARNEPAHLKLAAQFATRSVYKVYLALVEGRPHPSRATIDAAIARHPVDRKKMTTVAGRGRHARTDFAAIAEAGGRTVIACKLHTGRTHQIRVHMKSIGHPLAGDRIYNPKDAAAFPRLMLHAWKLGFEHPASGRPVLFTAPIPADMLDLCDWPAACAAADAAFPPPSPSA